ncbi:MAG: hypothetical protein FWD97_03515 [Defluviitaleaceae bacterium]|nr:hypothetical protein [Defluviitaleaceae bacterium]
MKVSNLIQAFRVVGILCVVFGVLLGIFLASSEFAEMIGGGFGGVFAFVASVILGFAGSLNFFWKATVLENQAEHTQELRGIRSDITNLRQEIRSDE